MICIWYVIVMLFICIATLKVLNSAVWTASPAPRPFLKEPCFVNTVNCVLSPLLFIILSISISALKRLKRLLDLHIVDIQQQFTSVFFNLTATITIQMQFDCGGGEDHECSDWLGIISIIVYNKFCSSGARVVTLVKKMIQSSYWNFSIQLILMIYFCFYQMLS